VTHRADEVHYVPDDSRRRIVSDNVPLVIAVTVSGRRRCHALVVRRGNGLDSIANWDPLAAVEVHTVAAATPVVCITAIVLREVIAVIVIEVEVPAPALVRAAPVVAIVILLVVIVVPLVVAAVIALVGVIVVPAVVVTVLGVGASPYGERQDGN
jgi:hypothetical protein